MRTIKTTNLRFTQTYDNYYYRIYAKYNDFLDL